LVRGRQHHCPETAQFQDSEACFSTISCYTWARRAIQAGGWNCAHAGVHAKPSEGAVRLLNDPNQLLTEWHFCCSLRMHTCMSLGSASLMISISLAGACRCASELQFQAHPGLGKHAAVTGYTLPRYARAPACCSDSCSPTHQRVGYSITKGHFKQCICCCGAAYCCVGQRQAVQHNVRSEASDATQDKGQAHVHVCATALTGESGTARRYSTMIAH
jgi:hypothetical protein